MLNSPADVLSVVLRGTLGRSGRKRARRATKFLTGHGGFLSASTMIAAAGVAWGIYDTLKGQNQGAVGAVPGVPPLPGAPIGSIPPIPPMPAIPAFTAGSSTEAGDPLARIIQLAVSAARADGQLTEQERAMITARASEVGLEGLVEAELNQIRQLADIVRGVTDPAIKKDLYVLAFAIVRADENVSGAERIYLAQLAHQLGLDAAAALAIETDTANKIDSQPEN